MRSLLNAFVVAARSRCPVVLSYDGKVRFVCVHMVGLKPDGAAVAHAYQYGGSTSRGQVESPDRGEWKYLNLDKVEDFSLDFRSLGAWYPAPSLEKAEYSPPKFVVKLVALAPREG